MVTNEIMENYVYSESNVEMSRKLRDNIIKGTTVIEKLLIWGI
ncbi:MAG: hypothetical protein Q4F66_01470 [Clostridium sp.]|nr:hypothetical protein [Clostridium sp.]